MIKKTTIKLFVLALIFSSNGLFAQEPTQQTHEKRVYINDGNTYVQKSLPLYLSFSTTKGGTQFPLTSKASAKYADPMFLDTEGVNYIRSKWAVDPESKKNSSTPRRNSV